MGCMKDLFASRKKNDIDGRPLSDWRIQLIGTGTDSAIKKYRGALSIDAEGSILIGKDGSIGSWYSLAMDQTGDLITKVSDGRADWNGLRKWDASAAMSVLRRRYERSGMGQFVTILITDEPDKIGQLLIESCSSNSRLSGPIKDQLCSVPRAPAMAAPVDLSVN